MKITLLFSSLLTLQLAIGQTTATDVTVTDCSGTSHNLFTELDAGKIIVVGWAMPCGACAAPLLSVHNSILPYAISNPGVVEYWLNDDYANTNCSTLSGWANTNGITNAIYFSAGQLSMSDYGSAGMPKVVILGCTNHKVYYNVNNSPGGTNFNTALATAVADVTGGCQQIGLEEESSEELVQCSFQTELNQIQLEVGDLHSNSFDVAIYSVIGTQVYSRTFPSSETNEQIQIPTSFWDNGCYFVRVRTSDYESSHRVEIFR